MESREEMLERNQNTAAYGIFFKSFSNIIEFYKALLPLQKRVYGTFVTQEAA